MLWRNHLSRVWLAVHVNSDQQYGWLGASSSSNWLQNTSSHSKLSVINLFHREAWEVGLFEFLNATN